MAGSSNMLLTVSSVQEDIPGSLEELLAIGLDMIFEQVLPLVMNNNILLAGVVLLAIALVVEVLNGLLDMVVYTAVAGGLALLMGGLILHFFGA